MPKRTSWMKFETFDRDINTDEISKKNTLIDDKHYQDTQNIKSIFGYLTMLISFLCFQSILKMKYFEVCSLYS